MTARKTVLITGASAGIGAATARLAAKNGYDVGIGYRSDKEGAQTVARDVEKAGGQAVLLPGDMGKPEDVERIFELFDTRFPKLDAFVNNAGMVDMPSRLEDMSVERIERMLRVNLTGALLAAGQAVKRMASRYGRGGGVIVNISSVAATAGGAHQYVDYAATKGAIDTLTKGLALENAEENIRVCGIRPGIIETEIHAKGGNPSRAQDLAHIVPMKRPGLPIEIAEMVLWMMSDKASYVTGSTIDISGGR